VATSLITSASGHPECVKQNSDMSWLAYPRANLGMRIAVLCQLAAAVAAVYLVVVVGGGVLIGESDRPSVVLSVVATGIVAIAFEPLREFLHRRFAVSPYDRLARFVGSVADTVATEKVAPELARLVAEGTRVAAAEVWLETARPGAAIEVVGRWPHSEDNPDVGVTTASRYPIRHGNELLGWLVVYERPGRTLEPIEQQLVADLCAQAGLALRHVQLVADLRRRVAESEARASELRSSRQRVVAVADAERRRLERNIHDGAQQHLLALAINLALTRRLLVTNPEQVPPRVAQLRAAVAQTLAVLEDLAGGIYPEQLVHDGVAAALSAAAPSAIPVTVSDATGGRYPQEVEATAYFCCLEAVQNAVKHSGGTRVCVRLSDVDGSLCFEVTDDGHGFDVEAAHAAAGTVHLRDRLETVGGHAEIVSGPTGTSVRGWIPVPATGSGELR
jgi:signal transduction histidine kinase